MSKSSNEAQALSAKRTVLLREMLKKKGIRVPEAGAVGRRPVESPCPLSFAQRRLWLLDRMEPGSSFYNIPESVCLKGALDLAALRRTLDEMVARHESLRTTFAVFDGQPMQVINEPGPSALPVTDLRGLPESERRAEANRLAAEEARRPFDLELGPLFRASLLRLGPEEHVLLLTMHHIVSDGWSLDVLQREVAALYRAFAAGEESPLTELPIQYADFAHWQAGRLRGENLERQLDYWRRQMKGAPQELRLMTDRPRPPVQTYRGATHSFRLGASLSASLKALARQGDATLFMLLLAAFQAMLSRYTGQSDVVVGSPIAGRTRPEIESLIGVFINTLVLRTDLSGDPTCRELLRRARQVCLGAYAHQDLPFEILVDELQPERSTNRQPLFQVMFVLQNATAGAQGLPGLEVSASETDDGVAKFDLSLVMQEAAEGICGGFNYNADLFDASTVVRMCDNFQTLLAGIVANPDERLTRLPLLSERERRFLLFEWNDTSRPFPTDACLHQLFSAQVALTPDSIAVTSGERSLTYSELERLSNRLARLLRSRGVGPDAVVGVLMRRSPELVVSLLAVLKAGGAYLPLDAALPPRRLSFMLEDSGSRLLLTQPGLLTALGGIQTSHAVEAVEIDSEWSALSGHDDDGGLMHHSATPDDLAYVIYTSGSTGTPKGVMVPHRPLVNYLSWALDAYKVGADTPSPVHSPLSFDLTVTSLWPPLLCGGRVELLDEGAGVEGLADALRAGGPFGVVKLTPAHMEVLRRVLPAEAASAASVMVIGGEALSGETVKFWREHAPRVRLVNEYGPTEATVGCCIHEVGAEEGGEVTGGVPIGRPIANARLYVLDPEMGPVPAGVGGELYIGGECLARGYLNRPGLTAERFVPDPFSGEIGARLYRTGDVVRHGAGGELEYVGRADGQVKVRGFRVELGEVEAVLRRAPGVSEAVAVTREDEAGDKRLVAYVVVEEGAAPTASALREYMRERVPEYMIPSAFAALDSLPLTSNGKVDKRALPEPEGVGQEGPRILARDVMELRLARMWEELLCVRPVGVRDNFFELGGNSMQAARLMFRIRETFGSELPLSVIFRESTVERLAGLLRSRHEPSPSPSALVEIQPRGALEPFFCVHPSGGGTLCYAPLAQHLGQGRPFYGLQSRGIDGEETPHARVEDMAEHYVREVRRVRPEGPYMLGGWSMGGVVAYEMARQLRAQSQEVTLLALIDSFAPHSSADAAEPDEASLLESFARDIGLSPEALTFAAGELGRLGPDERLEQLLERLKSEGLLPPDLELSRLRRHFNVFKANVRAMLGYRPRPSQSPIVLFVAEEKLAGGRRDTANGWGRLAAAGMELHVVPGDHFTMVREPKVRALAGLLRESLDAPSAVNA